MKFVLFSLCVILAVFLSTGCSNPKKTEIPCKDALCWENLIREHVKRYPLLKIADLYKLLYQSTLGNGHAIADSAEVAAWLSRDLMNLDENSTEPLADTLGSCGRFARVHIKTYVQYGGDPSDLLNAFMVTGKNYPPDSNAFFCALSAAKDMAVKGKLPWNDDSLEKFIGDQAIKHYPAVHHSESYDSAYHPAYRVIARELLPDLFKHDGKKVANINPSSLVSNEPKIKDRIVTQLTKKSNS
jgi:hypothetical protein